ncbi:SBBP repeat-containing protein [Chloroflexota bacterium]
MKWGSQGSGDGQFDQPSGVAVDASGNVYVTGWANQRIQKFDSDGNFITKWGSQGAGDGQINGQNGVAVGPSGNVYIADSGNNRIQVFSPERQPAVATSAATDVAATSAILNGNLTWLGAVAEVDVSFEYGLDTNYGSTSAVQAVTNTGPFGIKVEGLLPETTYHFRAKAEGDGIAYGEDMTVNTLVLQPPVVVPGAPMASGTLNSLGSATAVDVSFEYGLTSAYGISTAVQTMTSSGTFIASLDSFSPGTTYHIRWKAVGDATSYGSDVVIGGEGSAVPGDANNDGEVNALDITKTERLVAGLD